MSTVERVRDYQRYAAECLLLSTETRDPVDRGRLLAMAEAWTRLADLAEKNAQTDIVYETPPPARDGTGESGS